eukprot:TRINITY_DN29518_c0_g1_i2.p2 TRINITY_DN29518_c0_g1~~TRINITY_DN29518_c0_g1_i2.p2  ORF type:complete len:185 (-),score=22.33 TRINITY_DN29518_c0_g1_i2:108-662(-)
MGAACSAHHDNDSSEEDEHLSSERSGSEHVAMVQTQVQRDAEYARRLAQAEAGQVAHGMYGNRRAQQHRGTLPHQEVVRGRPGSMPPLAGLDGFGVPSSEPADMVYVACLIGNSTVEMMVDTGAQMSVISTRLSEQLGLMGHFWLRALVVLISVAPLARSGVCGCVVYSSRSKADCLRVLTATS